MTSVLRRTVGIIVLGLAAIPCALAQGTKVPPEVRSFAAQYVAAINAKDFTRLRSYFVPQSRACITPENKEVYDSVLAMQFTDHIPRAYVLTQMAVNQSNLRALSDVQYLPVKPERELRIDYHYPGTNDGGVVVLWLARQDGRWMDDRPCITAHGIKVYRENSAARRAYWHAARATNRPGRVSLPPSHRQ